MILDEEREKEKLMRLELSNHILETLGNLEEFKNQDPGLSLIHI